MAYDVEKDSIVSEKTGDEIFSTVTATDRKTGESVQKTYLYGVDTSELGGTIVMAVPVLALLTLLTNLDSLLAILVGSPMILVSQIFTPGTSSWIALIYVGLLMYVVIHQMLVGDRNGSMVVMAAGPVVIGVLITLTQWISMIFVHNAPVKGILRIFTDVFHTLHLLPSLMCYLLPIYLVAMLVLALATKKVGWGPCLMVLSVCLGVFTLLTLICNIFTGENWSGANIIRDLFQMANENLTMFPISGENAAANAVWWTRAIGHIPALLRWVLTLLAGGVTFVTAKRGIAILSAED